MLGCKFAANSSIDPPLYKVNSQARFFVSIVKRLVFALFVGFSKLLTIHVGLLAGSTIFGKAS
jgi:hypothetical protein